MTDRYEVSLAAGSALAEPAQREISDVVALFTALAVDWKEGGANRFLVARDSIAFVCTQPRRTDRRFQMSPGDIPVVVRDSAYNMRGFIKFESQYLYRGMFITNQDDDQDWYSAELTAAGVRFAQLGLFDVARLHQDIAYCPFFNPRTVDVVSQQRIEGNSIARAAAAIVEGKS